MFRGTKHSELSAENFSVGSIVAEHRDKYLVVGEGNYVRLLHMVTFKLFGGVTVEDPNFLSANEVHELISPLQVTMSDCDFDVVGMKS